MSYQTWHNYGYGICTDTLETAEAARIQALIHCAPEYEKRVADLLCQQGITEPEADDYLELEIDGSYGIASIMESVILESEGISLTSCDDYNGTNYLLYMPSYPWSLRAEERGLTEETVRLVFAKYVSILSDDVLDIDYQSIENGG